MALQQVRALEGDGFLAIWQVDAPAAEMMAALELQPADLERLQGIRHELGQQQWLGARLALKHVLQRQPRVVYDQWGGPHLEAGDYHISISHSAQQVVVLGHPTAGVGVDLQYLNPKIERIAQKFMHPAELHDVARLQNRLHGLHVYWSAKEALYKWYGRKRVDFREHLALDAFEQGASGTLSGRIALPGHKSAHTLRYEWLDESVLVYVFKDY